MGRSPLCSVMIIFLFGLLVSGCSHLPVQGALPESVRITEVSRVDAESPFAFDPAGENLALVDGGLRLKNIASGAETRVGAETPTALAWSPDGSRLAAAFPVAKESALRLYDRHGRLQAETRLGGRVSALFWLSSSEILAFAVTRLDYSFGANIAEILYRWDGTGAANTVSLQQTTLMPGYLRQWEGIFQRALTFSVSPLHDEMLYNRLFAPPAFSPYLKLMLRSLSSGKEREVAAVSLLSAGGVFSGDGESIVYGEGEGESRQLDPWGERIIATIHSPGRSLALSPSGRYLLADGRLFRQGKEVASFPPESAGAFSPRGGMLALRYGERLYLVAKLPDDAPSSPDATTAEQLRQLHGWVSEGLITPREYLTTRQRTIPR